MQFHHAAARAARRLAAVRWTVTHDANDFSLSGPGTVTILERPDTVHSGAARQASFLDRQAEQKERVLETFVKVMTTVETIVRSLARRAYRRPPTQGETART